MFCYLIEGWRKVPTAFVQVPWFDFRLHVGLVPAVAARGLGRCSASFPRGFYPFEPDGFAPRSGTRSRINPGERSRNSQRIFPKVINLVVNLTFLN